METRVPEPLRYEAIEGNLKKNGAVFQVEPVLDHIAGLSQRGEWLAAGHAAQHALLEGAIDSRLLATYYVSCFICATDLAFAPLLTRFADLALRETRDAAGPKVRSVGGMLHAALRDAWECTRFRATVRDDTWQRWIGNYRGSAWNADLAAATNMAQICTQVLDYESNLQEVNDDDERPSAWQEVLGVVSRVARWLRENVPELVPQVIERNKAAARREDGPNQASAATGEPSAASQPALPVAHGDSTDASTPTNLSVLSSEWNNGLAANGSDNRRDKYSSSAPTDHSPAWQSLQERIVAVAQLVTRGRHVRAAALAADVEHELANFDPARYFPQLLAPYYRALAVLRAGEATRACSVDEATSTALRHYSRADLTRFVDDDDLDEVCESA